MMSSFVQRLRAAALFIIVVMNSHADAPWAFPIAPFTVRRWIPEDGLPQSSIVAIAQTPDGYLWLGTFNGLARFDGVRFTVFNPFNTPALSSARVVSLTVDLQGALWGCSEDGGLFRMSNGVFERLNGLMGLPDGPVTNEGMDPDGVRWVRVGDRFFRLVNGRFAVAERVATAPARSLVTEHLRHFWIKAGNEWRMIERDVFTKSLANSHGMTGTYGAAPASDGDSWIVTTRGASKLRSLWRKDFPMEWQTPEPTDAVEDTRGNLIIATWTRGVVVLSTNGVFSQAPLVGLPTTASIRNLFKDREGNIWVGTDVGGLQRLTPNVFQYREEDGSPGRLARSVAQDAAGRMWRIADGDIEVSEDGGPFEPVAHRTATWWTMAADQSGLMWVGSLNEEMICFNGKNLVRDLPIKGARCLETAADGGVWAGNEAGIWRATTNALEKIETPRELTKVRAICERGDLWAGCDGTGLWRRSGQNWRNYGVAEGLTDPHVTALHQDESGAMWVGTVFGGLYRCKDGVIRQAKAPGVELSTHVLCILEDGAGYLWVGSLDGLHRLNKAELDAFCDGQRADFGVRAFNGRDGMRTAELSEGRQPTACRSRDGLLWFATLGGLCSLDPRAIPENRTAPTVKVEELMVNGAIVSSGKGGVFQIPPLPDRVEIRYTGINLKAGEQVRFKWRVSGLQEGWTPAGTARIAAFYRLPPGSYEFEVAAANEDGRWGAGSASLRFAVRPAWWQTRWFTLSWAGAAIGAVLGLFALRLRVLRRAQAAREAFSQQLIESQELERRRISADLHDGVGQALLLAKNRATVAAQRNARDPAGEEFDQIGSSVQTAINEIRSIVNALRPPMFDSVGLTESLRVMIQKAEQGGDVKFAVNLADMAGAIPAANEIELFRVAQEAVNNIIKHSNAATARVELRRETTRWILEIEDDGCGFLADERKGHVDGGFGLRGMRERLRILGGVLTIHSRPGEGTLLRAEAPIHGS